MLRCAGYEQRLVRPLAGRVLLVEVLRGVQRAGQDPHRCRAEERSCKYTTLIINHVVVGISTADWLTHIRQYLSLSPYNKDHYFVAFRNRTIQYNFTGAPPEWMAQMNDVFAQWQAEIAQSQGPPAFPSNMPYPVQQPHLAPPPPSSSPIPPHGMLSPPSPLTPLSQHSNATSPSMSPQVQVPQLYAHYAPVPEPTAIEMPGSLPAGAVLEPPPVAAPGQRPASVNVVRVHSY